MQDKRESGYKTYGVSHLQDGDNMLRALGQSRGELQLLFVYPVQAIALPGTNEVAIEPCRETERSTASDIR